MFVWRWFAGPDQLRLWWIWAALWVILAVVIVAVSGTRLTREDRPTGRPPADRCTSAAGPQL